METYTEWNIFNFMNESNYTAIVASCKRSYSKPQLFKNYLVKRNCQRGTLSTEYELSKEVAFENIFHESASIKARIVKL